MGAGGVGAVRSQAAEHKNVAAVWTRRLRREVGVVVGGVVGVVVV